MDRDRTHYEVLGVARNATLADMRRAHRELARLLHPDHLATVRLEPEDRRLADVRIREVNEAWRVLGDAVQRAGYDATLPDEPVPWIPPWEAPRPSPSRPPQRTATARRNDHIHLKSQAEPVRPFRWGPLMACLAIMVAGVVTLAVIAARSGPSTSSPAPSVPSGACVSIAPGPETVTVSCSGANDGKVVGFAARAADCPPGSKVRRLAQGDLSLACLVTVTVP